VIVGKTKPVFRVMQVQLGEGILVADSHHGQPSLTHPDCSRELVWETSAWRTVLLAANQPVACDI
jgi:hypothetical protein